MLFVSTVDYLDHAAANSILPEKRKYTHVSRQKGVPRESLSEEKTSQADCLEAMGTDCCKGRHCTAKFILQEVESVRR